MWAYAYENRISFDELRRVERPDPTPGPHDIIIQLEAVALNYRDLAIARGHYHVDVEPPLVPLSDGAGRVIAVGSDVTRFGVGDTACPLYLPDWIDGPISARVARRRLGGPTDGVLSEYMCVHEEEAIRAPMHLSPEEAAALPVAAVTAWHCLHETGKVRPGDTVLVQGAGAISTAAVQFAAAAGARVVSWIRKPDHAERLRSIGSDAVVTSDGDGLARKVFRMTGGRGADTVVDVAGGVSLAHSISATRVGGIVHVVGYAADTTARFEIFEAIRHAATMRTATAGSRESFEALTRASEQLVLRPAIWAVWPLSRISDGFEQLSAGGTFGKIGIRVVDG